MYLHDSIDIPGCGKLLIEPFWMYMREMTVNSRAETNIDSLLELFAI